VFFHPYHWLRFVRKQDFSLYIGTRLHGGIIALMNGVPAVFTSGDQRVSRFTSTFALPHCPQGLLIEDAANILIDWDYEHTVKLQNDASASFISSLADMRR
jgi:polysaccharide pyruvyl transferase WcaK-like protein